MPTPEQETAQAQTVELPAPDYVEREGILFEVGEYPHQNFSMSAEELAAAVQHFQPVPIELQHYDSKGEPNILSGQLGEVIRARVSEDGRVLMGTTRIPGWLHRMFDGKPIKVSSVFTTHDKRLARVGLVRNPQIPTAAIFEAYAEFAGARHSTADQADMQSMHDLAVKQGAVCPQDKGVGTAQMSTQSFTAATTAIDIDTTPRTDSKQQGQKQKENKNMSFMDRLADFIKGVPSEELAAFTSGSSSSSGSSEDPTEPTGTSTTTTTITPSPAPDSKVAALEAQLAQQTAAFAKVQDERRVEKATAKADAYIAQGKALPHERATVIAAFTRAMQDDEKGASTVTFSDAEGKAQAVTRTQLVELQYQARPAHTLTEEQVVAFALPTSGDNKDSEQDHQKKVDALISVTSMGKAALNGKNN